jgi:hypothetical protein|uniref:DUF3108 domain-containing protein n=1 Tax=Cephaloticoccus sp. TaxID=1985742 RepID=UPI00404A1C44
MQNRGQSLHLMHNFTPLFRLIALPIYVAAMSGPLTASPLPLSDGEQMTFRVGWGIFVGAGEIIIDAKKESGMEKPRLRITTTTQTRGFLKNFFPFTARSEAHYDMESGLLLHSEETSTSKRKDTNISLIFDYSNKSAQYDNIIEPERSQELFVPEGNPMDLITSLVHTRTWNLKPGEKKNALVVFGDDFYELTIYAERYETLNTPMGKFETLVLVPRMEKTEPKGMFKRGSTVRVWISQDERQLPIRFEVEFKFGAGVATLMKYKPPATKSVSLSTDPIPTGTINDATDTGS